MILVLITLSIYKAKDNYLKISSIFFLIIFIFKVIFVFNPPNLWSVCVDDRSTPIQSSFNYEYIDSTCTKSFNNLNSIFTDKVAVVSYETLDPNYEWLGANSANFPLGFLNHSKFNIYELRRDWLPFKMNLFKELEADTTQLEINYIGEITVKFSDGTSGFSIPTRYWNENTVIIDIPEGATHVTVKYSYTKWKIKQIPTLKSGYPYEKFAKLNIIEKGKNYGWPEITYGINYIGTKITKYTHKEGMEQPITHWTPSIAVCGIDFYDNNIFTNWENNLFVTSLKFENLYRLEIESGKVIEQELIFSTGSRVRDVETGPDGFIYVAIEDPGRIIRLKPIKN